MELLVGVMLSISLTLWSSDLLEQHENNIVNIGETVCAESVSDNQVKIVRCE